MNYVFRKEHIPFLNSRRLLSDVCSPIIPVYVRYSDASYTGCASYMLDFHNTISHKLWSVEEAQKSSSYRELKAISLGLESFCLYLKDTLLSDILTIRVFLELLK